MKIKILDKEWRVGFLRKKQKLPNGWSKHTVATCDAPETLGKKMIFRDELRGELLLDTVIHECLHAASFHQFDERFVDRLATEIAKAIWHKELLKRICDDPKIYGIVYEHVSKQITQTAKKSKFC